MRFGIAQTESLPKVAIVEGSEGLIAARKLPGKADFDADRSHQLSPVPAVALPKLLTRGLSMNMLRYSLAAAGMAALICGAGSNPARASGTATLNPVRIEGSAGTIVLAENKTKLKKIRVNNVILKGYDPV